MNKVSVPYGSYDELIDGLKTVEASSVVIDKSFMMKILFDAKTSRELVGQDDSKRYGALFEMAVDTTWQMFYELVETSQPHEDMKAAQYKALIKETLAQRIRMKWVEA